MSEPVQSSFGWTVLCPAHWGRVQPDIYSVAGSRRDAMERFVADWRHSGHDGQTVSKVWQEAYRKGWRLTRIEIRPMFTGASS